MTGEKLNSGRNDLNATAFHLIQRVFRAMTAGILKMLLPAWHVPELKKWIKIPDGADREDSDDSDGDGENEMGKMPYLL